MGRIINTANSLIHPILLRYLDFQYRRKNKKVRALHPELYTIGNDLDIIGHCKLWSVCSPNGKIDPSWYIMHSNLSGVPDIRYVPENIYFAYIEPILNEMDMAACVADKNLLDKYIPKENTPKTILRYMRGAFFDSNFKLISADEAQNLVDSYEELVIKPSVDSSGGNGVVLKSRNNPLNVRMLLSSGSTPFIIQEVVKQHNQSARFNPGSINTCRVMTLRCPWDGKPVLLKSMLRVGCGESFCDNMMRGGLCLGVADDGSLNQYAYDYNGKRYEKHPVSETCFSDSVLPLYQKMVSFALNVANNIPYMNILSFDLVANENGDVICLELNTAGQGVTQLQYDGVPLFREYTENVIEWCASHSQLNTQHHVKTFYW